MPPDSNQLLRATLDSSSQFIQVFQALRDEDGNIIDFIWLLTNRRWQQAYGEVIGERLLNHNTAFIQTGIFERMVKVMQTGVSQTHEHYESSGPMTGWFYSTLTQLHDGVVLTTEEIKPRQLAEQELLRAKEELAQQATQRYRELFQSIDQGFCTITVRYDQEDRPIDYQFNEVSPSFEYQTGIKEGAGKWMRDIAADQDQFWFDVYGRVAKDRQAERFEYFSTPLARWWSVYAFPIESADQRRIGVLFNDITERKQREKHREFLLQFSDKLRLVSNPDQLANRALQLLAEQLGLDRCYIGVYRLEEDRGEFTHQVGNDRVPPVPTSVRLSDFPQALRTAFEGTLVINDLVKMESLTDMDRQNLGALGFSALVASTLRKGEHHPLWSIVAISATPRYWKVDEIKLIDEVTERTWAALERAWAENALSEANRQKDEFLAMLAHELRNPLSTIRSGIQILTLTAADELTQSTVDRMNRQTHHLVHMLDDLLDVSRISQGKIDLKTEQVNLVDLVQQAVKNLQPLFDQQGKTLSVHLPSGPIKLAGDATRLTQVVTNLLTNGLRYTGDHGTVWLQVGQPKRSKGHTQATIQVRDNGIGLTSDHLSTIFELFVQADNSAARSNGGLGVGLTLVRRLVELHGGRVEAHSEGLGKGSTFTVYLPTLTTAAQPSAPSIPSSANTAPKQRILVVDDNADAAFTIAMLLKLKGYEAHTRNSGRTGIEAAEQLQPGAILLDIGMPELDGYATCELIRKQRWGQDVVVIALTGYGQPDDRQRTQAAGFDGHLVKPVDLPTLTKLLSDLLGTQRPQQR